MTFECKVEIDDHYEGLKQLQTQRESKEFCDVILEVENEEFHAHKNILAAYSDYFSKMFMIDMKEKYNKTITIQGVTVKAMKEVLNYIYTGTFELSEESLSDILHAAALMQLTNVFEECKSYMKNILNYKNCCLILILAEKYSFEKVAKSANERLLYSFAHENHECNEQWQFCVDKIEEIVESDDLEVFDEKQVFECILRWVNHDVKERKKHFFRLFQRVRLQFIGMEDLEKSLLQNDLVKDVKGCSDLVMNAVAYHSSPNLSDAQKFRNFFLIDSESIMLLPYQKCYQGLYLSNNDVNYEWKKVMFEGLTDETVLEGSAVKTHKGITVLCGGIKGENQTTAQVVRFDNARWMTMQPMKEARCGAAAVFHEEDLYVFGGEETPINNTLRCSRRLFNTEATKFSNSFEKLASDWVGYEFPFKISYFAAESMLGKIYLIGGYAPNNPHTNSKKKSICKEVCKDTRVYDPETNSWKTIGKLNEARACFGCHKESDTIYVVGGIGRNGSYLTSMEYLSGKETVWTVSRLTLPFYVPDAHVSTCMHYGRIFISNTSQQKFFRNFFEPFDDEYYSWKEEDQMVPDKGVLITFYQLTAELEAFAKFLE